MSDGLNKILYVEDDPDIQTVAKMAMEAIGGFTVEACHSGAVAMEVAADFAPDLILLDVMMPGMDGPTTLLALRGIPGLAETPVMFMTAKVMETEVERYLELGALDVIAKPFDPMTLAERIQDIWKRRHG
jgi:two-component system, OmpR family, response regulator